MEPLSPGKKRMDVAAYAQRVREGRAEGGCFICKIVERTHDYPHRIVYEDADAIAFLSRYPTLVGYCLVAPKRHVEDWVHDLDDGEFVALQNVVKGLARAVAAAVPTERMYCLSLGSQQGNAHVHWHLAPLPPGVPYEQQQFHALMAENGVVELDEDEQDTLARTIAASLRANL